MASQPIKKAVIAAAGFGTRFLPQTKAMPKEMLPLVDKPIIQYIVEELTDAGVEDIIIVTGYHKRAIEDHFDYMSAELRSNLKKAGKNELLEETKKISTLANFAYIRQKGPYGNATPLINAEHLLGNEPFIFTFADDFVKAMPSRFSQLVRVYERQGGTVLTAVRATKPEDFKRYGFVAGKEIETGVIKVQTIVEKPGTKEAVGSDLASVGGYILDPALFPYLHRHLESLEEGKEFIMHDALQEMIQDGHAIWACEIQNGKFYDTGDKLEYLKTVVDFALENRELGNSFDNYLRERLEN